MFDSKRFEGQLLAFITQHMQQDMAHDLKHVQRVVKIAKTLAQAEGARFEVVIPAAYLHDCFSYPKDHPKRAQSSRLAAQKAAVFLREIGYPLASLAAIEHAIEAHAYSAKITARTLEAKIVQDADRLDALGAIGISRCIQVGAGLGRALYASDDPFCKVRQPQDDRFSIDHFYTKLLQLKALLHTDAAKAIAQQREDFMRLFLAQLERELV